MRKWESGVFFLSDFLLCHCSNLWYYRLLLYYGKFFKKLEKNKNKLGTIYPKNHEYFKNSKPSVQFYWFLKKECTSTGRRKPLQCNEGSTLSSWWRYLPFFIFRVRVTFFYQVINKTKLSISKSLKHWGVLKLK